MSRGRAFLPVTAIAVAILSAGCGGGGGSSSSSSSPPPSPISVSISPSTTNVGFAAQQQFTATVSGTTNTAVTWSLKPQTGTISSSGLYTAPSQTTLLNPFANVPSVHQVTAGQTITGASVDLTPQLSSSIVTVTATSQADSTKSASATATIAPLSLFAVGSCGTTTCTAGSTGVTVTQGSLSVTLFLVGEGIQDGAGFRFSGSGCETSPTSPPCDLIQTAPPVFAKTNSGEPSAQLTINVSPAAQLGPRNIMVTDAAGELAAFPGGLLVCPATGCAN